MYFNKLRRYSFSDHYGLDTRTGAQDTTANRIQVLLLNETGTSFRVVKKGTGVILELTGC